MTHKFFLFFALIVVLLFANGCLDESKDGTLTVSWSFANWHCQKNGFDNSYYDCKSNNVETIHIKVSRDSETVLSKDLECNADTATLGSITPGTYSLLAEGLNEDGTVLMQSDGTAFEVHSSGSSNADIKLNFHPKLSQIHVNWNGCPSGVTLPYFITLYSPPIHAGDELTDVVTSVQESCDSNEVTLAALHTCDYVVEIDSRAESLKVYETASFSVAPGEDANVTVDVP